MERALGVVVTLGGTYLFLSVVVLSVVEAISGIFSFRAKHLRNGLERMLTTGLQNKDIEAFKTSVFEHPLVATLGNTSGRRGKLPSYVPTSLFTRAFLESVGDLRAAGADVNKAYADALGKLPTDEARTFVRGIVGSTLSTVEGAEARVGQWFDAAMSRLSGSYRRRVQRFTRVIAVLLVLLVNADTLSMGNTVWRDPLAREGAAQLAASEMRRCSNGDEATVACPGLVEETAQRVPVPLGWTWSTWNAALDSWDSAIPKLVGLVLTMIAVSLGAPFWFDLLRRLAPSLAQAGPKPVSEKPRKG